MHHLFFGDHSTGIVWPFNQMVQFQWPNGAPAPFTAPAAGQLGCVGHGSGLATSAILPDPPHPAEHLEDAFSVYFEAIVSAHAIFFFRETKLCEILSPMRTMHNRLRA